MMQVNDHILGLLKRHLEGSLEREAQQQLDEWVAQSDANKRLLDAIDDPAFLKERLQEMHGDALQQETRWNRIAAAMQEAPVQTTIHRIHFLRKWGWAAASLLILLCAGALYRFYFHNTTPPPIAQSSPANDVPPGQSGAILTLANGTQMSMDSLKNGLIATQNGAQVMLKNGQLAYDETGAATGEVVYNTIAIPKGRTFQVTLPDGTAVWLNSASAIRYPTAFTGNERSVEITGEAYFEVAKQANRPFRVNVNNKAEVEVLGTHFNVNAYENENKLNTTLLEGLIRVKKGAAQTVLTPGQQAQIGVAGTSISVISHVNTEKVMAWKNGTFDFDDSSLPEVMRQLERWYNIEVIYEHEIPEMEFGGKIKKDISLKGLLRALERTGVHFRIEDGRKLIVTR